MWHSRLRQYVQQPCWAVSRVLATALHLQTRSLRLHHVVHSAEGTFDADSSEANLNLMWALGHFGAQTSDVLRLAIVSTLGNKTAPLTLARLVRLKCGTHELDWLSSALRGSIWFCNFMSSDSNTTTNRHLNESDLHQDGLRQDGRGDSQGQSTHTTR